MKLMNRYSNEGTDENLVSPSNAHLSIHLRIPAVERRIRVVLQTALRRIYNTGYTNEAMCSRGCRGEGDEGDGTDDGRKGPGRGCCCDDLERNQRVA